jgi:hypothetical protein
MNHPIAGLNNDFFASQRTFRPEAAAYNNIYGKSQLDVCGAAINTQCGQSGASPSIVQPNQPSKEAASFFFKSVPL